MPVYEELLSQEPEWALNEGGLHFEEKSAVHRALRGIVRRLDALEIPYAISGAMALFLHGYRRFTEVVDILLTPEGLKTVHQHLRGLGYVPLSQGSRNLRDPTGGVRIEFLVTGEFPGDGKPKPVAFPDPAQVTIERGGIRYLRLPTLIELKLASGMTEPGRLRDLADVQDLIRLLNLPADLAHQLDPSVRDKYAELWHGLHRDSPQG